MNYIEFPLNEAVRGKNIQKIIYFPDSKKVFIWHDNKPIEVHVDLKSMAKTVENYYLVMNGLADNKTNQNVLLIMSDGLAPYMYDYIENGNGYSYGDSNSETNQHEQIEVEIQDEIPDKDYSGFIIKTIKRDVKRDDVLIRQVFYTGISTYTFEPINLGIISPTSEGKTYVTMKVMRYFPKDDVWNIPPILRISIGEAQ